MSNTIFEKENFETIFFEKKNSEIINFEKKNSETIISEMDNSQTISFENTKRGKTRIGGRAHLLENTFFFEKYIYSRNLIHTMIQRY